MNLETWEPVWWEPVVDSRQDLYLTLRLYNLPSPSIVAGARLYMDAVEYPVSVDGDLVRIHLTPAQCAEIPSGADARVYVDLADAGTVLWLSGKVNGGGVPR